MRGRVILPLLLMAVVGCRSHKESDIRVAETQQAQTVETQQARTDSRSDTQTEQAEAADSIVWTVSADSVVQTKADGTRETLHRVRWTRTAYKPTATATEKVQTQQTDTTSVVSQGHTSRQAAAQSHSESNRGGRPWWLLVVAVVATTILIYYARRWTQSRYK